MTVIIGILIWLTVLCSLLFAAVIAWSNENSALIALSMLYLWLWIALGGTCGSMLFAEYQVLQKAGYQLSFFDYLDIRDRPEVRLWIYPTTPEMQRLLDDIQRSNYE